VTACFPPDFNTPECLLKSVSHNEKRPVLEDKQYWSNIGRGISARDLRPERVEHSESGEVAGWALP
jgi:hypothetical protein